MAVDQTLLGVTFEEAQDQDWLEAHDDDLYDTIESSLKRLDGILSGVDCLLIVFPFLMENKDLRRWGKQISFALKQVQGYYKADYEGLPEGQIGDMYILRPHGSPESLTKSKRRRRQRVHPTEMLEAYLTLLMTQFYQQSVELTPERIQMTLNLARSVNDPYLYSKTYQTMAFIYIQQYDYERALDYANASLDYFHRHKDSLEQALTAYAMASAYRGLGKYEQALNSLDKAGNLFAKHEYPRQHGVIALETACCYEWMEDFPQAIQWAQIALTELEAQEMTYHTGMAYQCLSVCYAYTDQLDAAMANVEKSKAIWISLNNDHRRLEVEHLTAFIEAKMGRDKNALDRLKGALHDLEGFTESNWKDHHKKKASRLIQAIERKEDLSKLSHED
jgi:tetratricopeptide (TPR) repeat protein